MEDAADLKSASLKREWGFESLPRHLRAMIKEALLRCGASFFARVGRLLRSRIRSMSAKGGFAGRVG